MTAASGVRTLASMVAILEVERLTKRYGDVVAVDGVDLAVASGEIFGVLGLNGAGKTTLVECAQGLRHPDAGSVRLLGRDPGRERSALAERVGSQLQDSNLPERMRVSEAVRLFADRRISRDAVSEWGLDQVWSQSFGSLSGGQRQRLFIALALLNDPEVVFLDELTQGLDPSARRIVWDLVKRIRDRGTTVVLVTHFIEEAEVLCDRVVVMRDGRLVAHGSPADLVARHGPGVGMSFTMPTPTRPSCARSVACARSCSRVIASSSGATVACWPTSARTSWQRAHSAAHPCRMIFTSMSLVSRMPCSSSSAGPKHERDPPAPDLRVATLAPRAARPRFRLRVPGDHGAGARRCVRRATTPASRAQWPSDFYIAAYFGVVIAAVGLIMLPVHIASYREGGVLRRFDAAGFPRWAFPVSQIVMGALFIAVGAVILLTTAMLAYGLPAVEDVPRTMTGIAVSSLMFISIGVLLGMLLPNARAAQAVGLLLFLPMFLLAGGGPPPDAMSPLMNDIATALPLTHAVRAIQEPWLGLDTGTDHLVVAAAIFFAASLGVLIASGAVRARTSAA